MIAELYLHFLRKLRRHKMMKRWELPLWKHTLKAITFFYGPQSTRGAWDID